MTIPKILGIDTKIPRVSHQISHFRTCISHMCFSIVVKI
jgi:hypothetical protein